MTVFRDKDQFRKVGLKLQQTFRNIWSKGLNGKTQQEAADNLSKVRPWRGRPVILAGGALALLAIAGFGGHQYIKANTVEYYQVYKDGQAVGTVSEPELVEQMLEQMNEKVQQEHPDAVMVLEAGNITYTRESAFKSEPESEETLRKLESMIDAHATGVEVRVDGKLIGIAKNREAADNVLKQIKAQYAPESGLQQKKPLEVTALAYSGEGVNPSEEPQQQVLSVNFVEEVSTKAINIDPARVTDEEELYNRLVQGTTKPTQYTVQPGDCIGCIASKFDISPEVIYRNNDWIEDDFIKVGDVLDLTVLQPALTVETVENLTEAETIEPPVTIQKNPDMRAGESKVITPGKSGKKLVTYKLVKQNGFLMSEELVDEQIIEPAVPSIVMKGTKVILGEGSGNFRWPVTGARLTSKFGQRWGRLHKGIDLIGNKNIRAADNGVVEFVGTKNGMGKTIIIDHKNGYKTVYGHLSSYSVKKGEIVEKGDKIGIMGNTGHSTGTHLHFEIHKNGNVQNPMNYL
ncbi:peptidoglycan DD-metalloendopeptidase family protein [Paenibacillus tarimensis]